MRFDTQTLVDRFRATFDRAPSHLVRAPGRVNLIGEHIDYCGLSVLPMVLDRAVWLACRPNGGDDVRIATTEPGLEACSFSTRLPIPAGAAGDWANYARAAVQTLHDPTAPLMSDASNCGFDALVDADLPVASGLSSSSALVVATALAALYAAGDGQWTADDPAGRLRLADLLAGGERYVGTAGGGMDQAACLLGASGCAIRVDFDPLCATPVQIPSDWRFVIAYSGERAEKSGATQRTYNERTAQALEAVRIMWAAAGELHELDVEGRGGLRSYRALIERPGTTAPPASMDPVLAARFSHIVSEARRVHDAEAALRDGDLARFGALLSASHQSLRDRYEVSTSRLDALVETALTAGAAGARLTGAGLGGSIVALCEKARTDRLLDALAEAQPFIAVPSDGASVSSLAFRSG